MDVRCERCRAEYAVDETRIPEAGVKVACTSCGHGFLLRRRTRAIAVPLKAGDGDATTPLPELAPGRAGPGGTASTGGRGEWKLRQASGAVFPFRELSTLQRWIVERKAVRTDEITQAGPGESWRRLGEIPELASFFELVDRARGRRDAVLEPDAGPEPEPEPERARGPGTEDPAWAQGPAGPTRRVTRPIPMPRRPRRPLLWVSGLALALLGVAAVTVYLHRKAAADLAAQAGPPPPVPVASRPVEGEPGKPPAPVPADPPRDEPSVQAAATAAPAPSGPERVEPAAAPVAASTPAPPVEPAPTPATQPGAAAAAPQAEAPAVAPAPAPPAASRPAARPAAPDPSATLRTTLARAREQRDRGRCEAALELYGQALGIDGRNAAALAGRGACYLELSRYAQAEASFEAALESDPRNAEALFGLGETYRYMGRKPEAVALYERFLVVRPTGDEAAAARRLVVQLKE